MGGSCARRSRRASTTAARWRGCPRCRTRRPSMRSSPACARAPSSHATPTASHTRRRSASRPQTRNARSTLSSQTLTSSGTTFGSGSTRQAASACSSRGALRPRRCSMVSWMPAAPSPPKRCSRRSMRGAWSPPAVKAMALSSRRLSTSSSVSGTSPSPSSSEGCFRLGIHMCTLARTALVQCAHVLCLAHTRRGRPPYHLRFHHTGAERSRWIR
mmetsp:Transcript_59202/g.135810  ORF Transcript_59202/g.135810 Transcript_59202/m.135810 type:complete len:215 (+) Transcript_59202:764-1408(+)